MSHLRPYNSTVIVSNPSSPSLLSSRSSIMEQAPDTVNVNLLGPFPPILGSAEPGFASTQLANVAKANASPSPQDTSTERCSSPTETIRPSVEVNAGSITPQTTAERAFQHGLDRGNLEQEVGQVLGTLNSWWGGVKQQVVTVSLGCSRTCLYPRSPSLPSRASRRTSTKP